MRRVNLSANHLIDEHDLPIGDYEQLDLFTDYDALERERREQARIREREAALQRAILQIHRKYGKNALLKGMNFEQGAMTIERNGQVGGHKA